MYPSLIVVLVCLRLSQRDHMDRMQREAYDRKSDRFTPTSPRGVSSTGTGFRSNRPQRAIEIRVEELRTYTTNDIELPLRSAKEVDSNPKHAGVSEEDG